MEQKCLLFYQWADCQEKAVSQDLCAISESLMYLYLEFQTETEENKKNSLNTIWKLFQLNENWNSQIQRAQ